MSKAWIARITLVGVVCGLGIGCGSGGPATNPADSLVVADPDQAGPLSFASKSFDQIDGLAGSLGAHPLDALGGILAEQEERSHGPVSFVVLSVSLTW